VPVGQTAAVASARRPPRAHGVHAKRLRRFRATPDAIRTDSKGEIRPGGVSFPFGSFTLPGAEYPLESEPVCSLRCASGQLGDTAMITPECAVRPSRVWSRGTASPRCQTAAACRGRFFPCTGWNRRQRLAIQQSEMSTTEASAQTRNCGSRSSPGGRTLRRCRGIWNAAGYVRGRHNRTVRFLSISVPKQKTGFLPITSRTPLPKLALPVLKRLHGRAAESGMGGSQACCNPSVLVDERFGA
jgi:hypothetical protein